MPVESTKSKDYVKYQKTQDLGAVYEHKRINIINVAPNIVQNTDYIELKQPTKSLLQIPPNKVTGEIISLSQETQSKGTLAVKTPQFDAE